MFNHAQNIDARGANLIAVGGDQYIINQCFTITPVPHLSKAFSSFKFIIWEVKQVQLRKRQLSTLKYTIAMLLQTLDEEYCEKQLSKDPTAQPLADLQRYI
jgi:hypothetical protein